AYHLAPAPDFVMKAAVLAGVAKHAGGRRHGALGRDVGAASRGDAGLGVLTSRALIVALRPMWISTARPNIGRWNARRSPPPSRPSGSRAWFSCVRARAAAC